MNKSIFLECKKIQIMKFSEQVLEESQNIKISNTDVVYLCMYIYIRIYMTLHMNVYKYLYKWMSVHTDINMYMHIVYI